MAFGWAAAAVASRAFSTAGAGASAAPAAGGLYMLPLVDMLNHCRPAERTATLCVEAGAGGAR